MSSSGVQGCGCNLTLSNSTTADANSTAPAVPGADGGGSTNFTGGSSSAVNATASTGNTTIATSGSDSNSTSSSTTGGSAGGSAGGSNSTTAGAGGSTGGSSSTANTTTSTTDGSGSGASLNATGSSNVTSSGGGSSSSSSSSTGTNSTSGSTEPSGTATTGSSSTANAGNNGNNNGNNGNGQGNNGNGNGNGNGNNETGSNGAAASSSPPPAASSAPSTQPQSPQPQSQQQAACARDGITAADASGDCGKRRVPVTFSTSSSASSVTMCAEPAAFAAETGTLRLALCWRDSDLPAELLLPLSGSSNSSSAATLRVTLPRLQRYGVASMAAGSYSLGVDGAVEAVGGTVHAAAAALAAASGAADVPFGPLPGGSVAAALAVPPGGVDALTLWFEVPALASAAASAAAASSSASKSSSSNNGNGAGNGSSSSSSSSAGSNGNGNGGSNSNGSGSNGNNGNSTNANGNGNSGNGSGNGNGDSGAATASSEQLPARTVSLTLTGPPHPPSPAATCKCSPAASAYPGGACPAGTAPLTATLTSSASTSAASSQSPSYAQCVAAPAYDRISRRLVFSACWRYACLPDAFARQPYTLTLGPLAAAAAGVPPAGHYRLRGSVPAGVAMSLEWLPASNATAASSAAATAAAAGGAASATTATVGAGWRSAAALGGAGLDEVAVDAVAIAVVLQVPFDMAVDDAAGSLELKYLHSTCYSLDGSSSGGSAANHSVVIESPDGGGAVTLPSMPAAAADGANATLTAVSHMWVPRRVVRGDAAAAAGSHTVAELEAAVRSSLEAAGTSGGAAAAGGGSTGVSVSVAVAGYRVSIPIGLQDFSAVPDCGAESLALLRSLAAAASLPGGAALLGVSCAYAPFDAAASAGGGGGVRRRSLTATTTATSTSACSPRISVPVTLDSSATGASSTATAPADLDTLLSASVAALSASYGGGGAGAVCPLDPSSPTIEVVSKLSVSVTMPAAKMMAAAAAAAAAPGGDAVTSACTSGPAALASSMGLGTAEAQVVGCELSAAVAGPITVITDPSPTSSSGAGPDGAPRAGATGTAADVTAASPQSASGGGGGGGGASTVLIGVAVAAGITATVVVAAAAVLVTRRRQRARAAAAAANGEPLSGRSSKYNSRRPSLSGGGVEEFEPDSDDSAGQAMRDAALGAKRQRRVSYGGGVIGRHGDSADGGGGGGFFGRASKTAAVMGGMRGVSNSGAKAPSARPSLFGTDSRDVGMESAFLSIVPDTNHNSSNGSDPGPRSAPPSLPHAHVNTWTPSAIGRGCTAVAAAKSRTSRASRGSAGAGAGAAGVLGSFKQGSQSWYPTPYGRDDEDGECPRSYGSNGRNSTAGRVARASKSHTEGGRRTTRSSGALAGASLWARVSHPGRTPGSDGNEDDDDDDSEGRGRAMRGSASESDSDPEIVEEEQGTGAVPASGLSMTGRFRRLQQGRQGSGSGPRRASAAARAHHSDGCAGYGGGAANGFDFFGLDELVGAEDLAGVMRSMPTVAPASATERLAARRSCGSSSQVPPALPSASASASAARRRSRSNHPAVAGVGSGGGAAPGGSPFLRRSHNAGLLGSNPAHPDVDEEDGDEEQERDAAERLFTRSSYGAPAQHGAAGGPSRIASVAGAGSTAGSGASAASQRVWIRAPPPPPAAAAANVAFVLPGAGAGDAVRATSAAELAAAAAGCDEERDLLRVQSRRPGFVDRSAGGSLAAAVASSVCSAAVGGCSHPGSGADTDGAGACGAAAFMLEDADGDGYSAASSGGGGAAAAQRRHSALDAAARVEPRRAGFIRARRHNSVAPYLGPGSHPPPAYIPHLPPGAAAVGGFIRGGGGAGGGGSGSGVGSSGNSFTAWSAPATAVNSPGAGGRLFADAAAWAGVVGAGRRSSAGAAYVAATGGAAAGDNDNDDDAGALYGDDGRWEAHRRIAPLSGGGGAAAGMPRGAAGLNLSRGPSSRSRDRQRDGRNSGPGDEGDDEAEAEAAAAVEPGTAAPASRRPRRCSGAPDAAGGAASSVSGSTASASVYDDAGPDSRERDSEGKYAIRRAPFVLGSGALEDAEAAATAEAQGAAARHGRHGDAAVPPSADAEAGVDHYDRVQLLAGPHTRPRPPHALPPLVSHVALAAANVLAAPAAGGAEAEAEAPEPLSSAALAAVAALEGAAPVLPCGTGAAAEDEAPSAVVGGRAHFRLRRSNASSVVASRPPSPPPEEVLLSPEVLLPPGEAYPAGATGAPLERQHGEEEEEEDDEEDPGPRATHHLLPLPPSPSPPPLLLAELPDASDRDSAGSGTLDAAAAEAVAAAAAAAVGAAHTTGGAGARHLASMRSNGTAASMEEVAPAFGAAAVELLRARQPNHHHAHHGLAGLIHDGSSAASSAASSMNGRGGLVDQGMDANAEGGAARLTALRRLAVGPSRPAWGLVHAGVGPFKRSNANVHAAAASVNNRGGAAAAAAAALAAASAQPLSPRSCALREAEAARATSAARAAAAGAPAAQAAPGAVSDGGFSPRGGGPRGTLPRLLSRNSTGGLSIQSSDASGPFIRLVGDAGVLSPRPSGAHQASLDM
ncbi:hypothetical protein HXX76_005111 [Chlamydomonas incerta]|uniref:Uncharacterized protein n=1 Tax=Chlamydomonas incerta TaxID=51695 RepID=A0A835TIV9_CHLIN|nr:hypothetical protein HXX76_005111 [Chlamydomonas incerta]|eukprot:KAG2438560.1 hypothetical protein HXX76_005111 [Chlamydomonas incerta]